MLNLDDAEDIWHSKQRITEVATSDIWEQIGDLSGRNLRLKLLSSKYKIEAVEQVKQTWYKRVTRIKNQCFAENSKNPKTALNVFEKDNFIKELRLEIGLQIESIKVSLMHSTATIINQELEPQIPFIQRCIDQLDKNPRIEIGNKINTLSQTIANLVEQAFTDRICISCINVKRWIDYIKNAAERLANQGVLGISKEQFTKCYEEVANKLETIVIVIFDELIRLAMQGIEQAIAFYNDFLERQIRYQQETPEQRQAEKDWIDRQRLELARVQNGIDSILKTH